MNRMVTVLDHCGISGALPSIMLLNAILFSDSFYHLHHLVSPSTKQLKIGIKKIPDMCGPCYVRMMWKIKTVAVDRVSSHMDKRLFFFFFFFKKKD